METNVEATVKLELINTIRNSKIGDVIRFGSYDWYVYALENNILSLLCKDAVKTGTYHSSNSKMT